MKIKFIGAAREVTGSKHLIVTRKGKKILLDCGMFQGKGLDTDSMNRNLGFNPSNIDFLLLSHAHIDHSGLIPYIYKLGFRGDVICTHATRDLCAIMLADSGHIHEQDTMTFNKKRAKKGLPPVEPIYTKEDAYQSMKLFTGLPYNKPMKLDDEVQIQFTNTGHLLGGSVVNIIFTENERTTRLAYTGDIGRPVNRILESPKPFPQADLLICESTYGDRLHSDNETAEKELLDILIKTCVNKGGKLVIPSFSIGRTQELVYTLNNLSNANRLPKIDIFVDSPLAMSATDIFRLHPDCFNDQVLDVMINDPDPFGFNNLHYVRTVEESKRINSLKKPCVIISASGMAEAGRIKHHLANNISDPQNTILFVGYCSPATLGAKIMRGEKRVSIHGNSYEVRAEIKKIESYSGHADYEEMLEFLKCQEISNIQQTFLVHGEYDVQEKFKVFLENSGFKNVFIPESGDEFKY